MKVAAGFAALALGFALLGCSADTPKPEPVPVVLPTPAVAPPPPVDAGPTVTAEGEYLMAIHGAPGGDCAYVPGTMLGFVSVTKPKPDTLAMLMQGFDSACEGAYKNGEFLIEACTLDFADGPNLVTGRWVFEADDTFSGDLSVKGGDPVCTTKFTVFGTRRTD